MSLIAVTLTFEYYWSNLIRGGSSAKLQYFLIASTVLLYLVAAGLFSRAVWYFEQQQWNNLVGGDAAEVGVGPGSYDIDNSVWHVNVSFLYFNGDSEPMTNIVRQCCSPELNGGEGGWGVFNGILGWTNSATYGSVISYNVYWIFVISAFFAMRYHEVKGHWPLMRAKNTTVESTAHTSSMNGTESAVEKTGAAQTTTPA